MTTITNPPPDQHIDSTRLSADFQALARIGIDPDGYCNRPVFSPAHKKARAWFREQALFSGFEFIVDRAGNHSAYLNCGPTGAPSVLISSHLDSVPRGSAYESSTGIPSAMETLRTTKASGASLKFNLEAIDLTDKHGALIGQLGSRALAGTLTLEDLQHPRGGRGRLLEELTKADLNEAGLIRAGRDPRTLIGNIELQIDLSGQLRRTNASIGIVTDIAGIVSYRILFIENRERDWTGSTSSFPTSSQGASSFVLSTRQLVLDHFPGCTANTGMIEFHLGEIPRDIPDHVAVSLEFRALNPDTLNRLETALIDLAHNEARKYALEYRFPPEPTIWLET